MHIFSFMNYDDDEKQQIELQQQQQQQLVNGREHGTGEIRV